LRRDKATTHRRHSFLADCSGRDRTANGTGYDEPIVAGVARLVRNSCPAQLLPLNPAAAEPNPSARRHYLKKTSARLRLRHKGTFKRYLRRCERGLGL